MTCGSVKFPRTSKPSVKKLLAKNALNSELLAKPQENLGLDLTNSELDPTAG